MNGCHLLRKIPACSNKVSWVVLIDHNFDGQELAFLTFNSPQQFFHFLLIGIALIRVFVKCIETLCHDFCDFFKAHGSFVFEVKLVQFRLGNGCSLAEFSFSVVMVRPGLIGSPTILGTVVRFNPGPAQ